MREAWTEASFLTRDKDEGTPVLSLKELNAVSHVILPQPETETALHQ